MHQKKSILLATIFFLIALNSFSQKKHNTRSAKHVAKSEKYILESKENDSLVSNMGYDILDAIFNSDAESYMSYFDVDTFGNLITADTKSDDESLMFRNGFLKGMKSNLISLPQKIINDVEASSYYDFVNFRYDSDNKTYYLLFRIFSVETGINYHDYKVSKLNNKFVFSDIYIYLSGEELSNTFKRLYLYNLPKKSLFSIFGESKTDDIYILQDAVKLHREGQFNKAYEKFKAVKGDLGNDKFTLLLKALCASQISDEEHQNSIEEIMNKYPDDSSLYLSQIDYYIMKNDYDSAFSLLDRLEDETSDDFLRYLKGNLEYERGNYVKAEGYFEHIIDNYTDFFHGDLSYLSCLTKLDKLKESIDVLDGLLEKGYPKTDLIEYVNEVETNGYNELESLANSNLFKLWKEKK